MTPEDRFYRNLGERAADLLCDGQEKEHGDLIAAQSEIEMLCHDWKEAVQKCSSPIEALLLSEFLFASHGYGFVSWEGSYGSVEMSKYYPCSLFQMQAPVGKYRADFLFTCHVRGHTRRVVVECDGHDYHERTKQQAQRDKARDRFMVAEGVTVLRFTGSEIYRDPAKCREQVEVVLARSMESAMAAAGIVSHKKDRP